MEKFDNNDLLFRLGNLEGMSADEARALLDEVSEDGIVSRAEAEAIIKINRKLDDVFPDWDEQFCGLIKSFLLTVEEPVGWIDLRKSNWLAAQFAPLAGDARRNEFDLLLSILPHTDGVPVALIKCILEALVAQAVRSARMTRGLVEHLRSILLVTAVPKTPWITKWEAQILLKLNDRIRFARNDESWTELYTRAMANHLIAMAHPAAEDISAAIERKFWLQTDTEAELGGAYILSIQSDRDGTWFERMSPSLTLAASAHARARAIAAKPVSPSADDDDWLVKRLGWNNRNITPADRALIGFLDAHTPGFTQGLSIALHPPHSAPEMAVS